jgi:hypothetical protein
MGEMLVKASGGFLFSAMLTELDEISLLTVYGLERFVFFGNSHFDENTSEFWRLANIPQIGLLVLQRSQPYFFKIENRPQIGLYFSM